MIQQTSLFAYHNEIKPSLSDRHDAVMNAFDTNDGFTNKELASFLGWEINRVTPRVNELVKMGLLEEKTRRPCKETGRSAIVWGAKKQVIEYF